MQENDTRQQGLDVRRMAGALLHRWWLIVVAALIFGIIGYIYTKGTEKPMYRSGFTAYVNNRMTPEGEGKTSTSDLSASMGLMYVYQEVLTSRRVRDAATAACYPVNVSGAVVRVSVSTTSPMLTVYVEATDPDVAKTMADAVAQVAPEVVAYVAEGSSMKVIDSPLRPAAPFAPRATRTAAYWALVGACLMMIVILILDMTRDHVRDSEDMESRYDIPVIGRIPDMLAADKNAEAYGYGKAVTKRK